MTTPARARLPFMGHFFAAYPAPQVDEHPPYKPEPEPHMVVRTAFATVQLSGDPQSLDVSHCARSVQVDAHYGEFQLQDDSGRVLAVSRGGFVSLLKKDLQLEAAKVWYDALARTSAEHKRLVGMEDPGLDLGGLQPLFIRFLNVPDECEKHIHVPVRVQITAIWNPATFLYET